MGLDGGGVVGEREGCWRCRYVFLSYVGVV